MGSFLFLLILLFLLLIFHNAVISGTQNGLLLWYQILIPSLLPFLLVTNALSETNAYGHAAKLFSEKIKFPIYEIMAIFLGNLCGYPIGGKIISDFVNNGCLSPQKANHLLAFASQSSPMFLIGYVHIHILKDRIPLFAFLGSIYLPILLFYPFSLLRQYTKEQHSRFIPIHPFSIKDTFLHAVQIMVIIGIYVIIFSIFLAILLPFCKPIFLRIMLSFFEITTGLKLLANEPLSDLLKTSLICSLSAFGGLCSAFQIHGVLNYSGAQIKRYLFDKLLLSTGTFFLAYCYLLLCSL